MIGICYFSEYSQNCIIFKSEQYVWDQYTTQRNIYLCKNYILQTIVQKWMLNLFTLKVCNR